MQPEAVEIQTGLRDATGFGKDPSPLTFGTTILL